MLRTKETDLFFQLGITCFLRANDKLCIDECITLHIYKSIYIHLYIYIHIYIYILNVI